MVAKEKPIIAEVRSDPNQASRKNWNFPEEEAHTTLTILNVLLANQLALLNFEWEGCNIAHGIHVGIAGPQAGKWREVVHIM